MPDDRIELPGSRRPVHHRLRRVGPAPGGDRIVVSVYLAPRSPPAGGGPFASRAELRERRTADHADDVEAVAAFAGANGLEVAGRDAGRRLVTLAGPASAMAAAFGADLARFEDADGRGYRGREGAIHLPADLAGRVTAVLGLDDTPVATAKIVPHRGPTPPPGFLPSEVAALYGVAGASAAGECVAIIELGGGFTDADNQAAFGAMGLPVPDVVAVPVDGGANAPGGTDGADGEVALDIQVAGGVAPGARLAVYFAPNTSQGFADAISQAVHDEANRPTTMSISWGSAEGGWSGQAIAAMRQAFADAAALGVSVFAASGDGLATDGEGDGKLHVDYPASDPLVVGCGGTRITAEGGRITAETVWNSNGGGTGGGVSTLFARPAYQEGLTVPAPPTANGGRGVPDVAGDADPDSGYRIWTDGKVGIVGGTSAVAPLWAAIAAGLNAARGEPLGDPHAALYAAAGAFRDVTRGNNRAGSLGYAAAKGWDPCTGLGAPLGDELRRALGTAKD